MMDKGTHRLINGILTICFYNGYQNFIIDLVDYLKEQIPVKEYTNFMFQDFSEGKYAWNYDNFDDDNSTIHTIQMLLVNEYGDYGTSIRFGWIDSDNYQRLLDDLNYVIEDQWQDKRILKDGSIISDGDNPFKRKKGD
jgi:hypothetical protein